MMGRGPGGSADLLTEFHELDILAVLSSSVREFSRSAVMALLVKLKIEPSTLGADGQWNKQRCRSQVSVSERERRP